MNDTVSIKSFVSDKIMILNTGRSEDGILERINNKSRDTHDKPLTVDNVWWRAPRMNERCFTTFGTTAD
jgi:hypothetical protein